MPAREQLAMRGFSAMRFRFRLLTLMIFVAITALAAWGVTMKRRAAERARQSVELARRSAEFTARAEQHHQRIDYHQDKQLWAHGISFRGDEIPVTRSVDKTPQDAERHLRYLEQFYGYGLTERQMERRDLTEGLQAEQMLTLLWLRYEVHMYFKYRRAAAEPWLPIAPGPPKPPFGSSPPQEKEWWKNRELPVRIAEYLKSLTPCAPE
jgi:hypothetical protein